MRAREEETAFVNPKMSLVAAALLARKYCEATDPRMNRFQKLILYALFMH